MDYQALLVRVVFFLEEYLLQVLEGFWGLQDLVSRVVEVVAVGAVEVRRGRLVREAVDW